MDYWFRVYLQNWKSGEYQIWCLLGNSALFSLLILIHCCGRTRVGNDDGWLCNITLNNKVCGCMQYAGFLANNTRKLTILAFIWANIRIESRTTHSVSYCHTSVVAVCTVSCSVFKLQWKISRGCKSVRHTLPKISRLAYIDLHRSGNQNDLVRVKLLGTSCLHSYYHRAKP